MRGSTKRTLTLALILGLTLSANHASYAESTDAGAGTIPAAVSAKTTVAPATAVPAKVESKAASVSATAAASQPVATPTKDVPKDLDPDDIAALIKAVVQAAKGGHWALLVGLVLMVLTWVVNRLLKNKIPVKVLPWLSVGLGVLTQIALTVAVGDMHSADTWISAVTGGITLGLTGAGGWSALGKYIPGLRKPTEKPTDAAGDVA